MPCGGKICIILDIDDFFGYWATRANNMFLYEETQIFICKGDMFYENGTC